MKLATTISHLPLVGEAYADKLAKLGITTIDDLLHHIPFRYNDFRVVTPIAHAQIGENITLHAQVIDFQNIFTKNGKRIQIAKVKDDSGELQVLWFNMPFLSRVIYIGESFCYKTVYTQC
jgi:ATP-dependent DNA helicase RecG